MIVPAAVVAATACGSSTLPSARILSIDAPSQSPTQRIGYIGEDLVLTVRGEGFSDGIVPNAGDPGASKTQRVQMFIQLQGDPKPRVAVQGTFLSPTLFEGTLPIDPGVYDLTLENGGGEVETITDAFQMGHRATTLMLIGPDAEEPSGQANAVTLEMRLVAANGIDLGVSKDPLELMPDVEHDSPSYELLDQPGWVVTPGATFSSGVMTVVDSASELVIVTVPGLAGMDIALDPPMQKQIEFRAGTAVRARVLTATEVAGNLVDTFLQVEDAWGNAATAHLAYQASGFSLVACPGGSAVSEPILVAASSGVAAMQFTCNTTGVKTVVFTEDTATPYANGGGVIIFN